MATYSGAESTFLTDAFTSVNNALNTFVTTFSTNISSEIAPIVMSGLILSFIVIGIMAIRGLLNSPFQEVAWKMVFVSVVTSIALTAGVYQKYIIDVFITMPDDLISSIVAKSINGVQTGSGAGKAIEQLYDLGAYNASLYIDQAGVSLTDGVNFAPYIMALMVFLGTVMCCIVGTLWLFIAKIVLALMLAVGPLFIVALCWKPTEQFFYKWLGILLNTIFSAIFVVAVFFIFSTIFKSNLEALEITQETANFMDAGTFLFFGLVCMGVLLMIPNYVTQLTGGAVGAVGTAMASIGQSAMAYAGGAAGAAKGAAATGARGAGNVAVGGMQRGFAAKEGLDVYKKSRELGNDRSSAMGHAYTQYQSSMSHFRRNTSNTQRNK